MARFEALAQLSNLALQGQTSLHPILVSTDKMTGVFEIGMAQPGAFDLAEPPTGQLEIYVEDLKSESYLDVAVRDRLNTRRYPKIVAVLTELREHETEKGRYLAVGDISFHGVTRREAGEISVRWLDDITIEVKGEIWIDVRDYDVEIPRLITSTFEPSVKVRLRMMLKRTD
jgi:hypothetical protein